jgi:hypothetical protein
MVRSGRQGAILLCSWISHACVGEQGSTTFHVLTMLQHHSIATLLTRARYRGSLVLIALYVHGLPVLSLTLTNHNGHRTWVRNTLRIQGTVGTNVEPGRGRDTRWLSIRFQEGQGEVEQPPFLLTPSRTNVADATNLATIHIHAIGRLVRCK